MTLSKTNTNPSAVSGWRKSSKCESSMCIGVNVTPDAVLIANTANLADHLAFTPAEWRAFIAGVRAGDFDAR